MMLSSARLGSQCGAWREGLGAWGWWLGTRAGPLGRWDIQKYVDISCVYILALRGTRINDLDLWMVVPANS